MAEDEVQHHIIPPAATRNKAIVTSCEEDTSDSSSSSAAAEENNNNYFSDDNFDDEPLAHTQPDYLFDDQADEEDEAYVYKHLRSGVEENVTVVKQDASKTNDNDSRITGRRKQEGMVHHRHQQVKMLKPRNSDAVLSCPCCFNIVCMDCQQHERYENQYRAMFVMNIMVRWDLKLQYSSTENGLIAVAPEIKSSPAAAAAVPPPPPVAEQAEVADHVGRNDEDEDEDDDSAVVYYTVCCDNCQTTVAYLDMKDEVYHFSGCLASS